jgi:predicted RNA binding protein with dsRBD fold (UPF0201 family)
MSIDAKVTDSIHKVITAAMVAALTGMFKFYVDVSTELAVLTTEVEQANESAVEILQILDTIAPRTTTTPR